MFGGKIDKEVANEIDKAREYWKTNDVKIKPMNEAIVTKHPGTSIPSGSSASKLVAGTPYEGQQAPHDDVKIHYAEKADMFAESVLVPPRHLAKLFQVRVEDLPFTKFVSAGDDPMVMDIVRFRTEAGSLITEKTGELDLEDGNNLEAAGHLQIALDNYHKNYHFILDSFGIEASDLAHFSGVYIERNDNDNWEAVQYQATEVDPFESSNDSSGGKRKRFSNEFSSAEKPAAKRRDGDGDVPSKMTAAEKPRMNSYTEKTEWLDTETRKTLYTFANKDDALRAHRKFMDIAVVLSGAALPRN